MKSRIKARTVAVSGILTALSVTLLYLGSLLQTLTLSLSAVAALPVLLLLTEYGAAPASGCYVASGLLGVLLCVDKTVALAFLCFFGAYPFIKRLCERIPRKTPRMLAKLAFVLLLAALYLFLYTKLLLGPELSFKPYLIILAGAAGLAAFLLYDILLTRLMRIYAFRLRPKISKLL